MHRLQESSKSSSYHPYLVYFLPFPNAYLCIKLCFQEATDSQEQNQFNGYILTTVYTADIKNLLCNETFSLVDYGYEWMKKTNTVTTSVSDTKFVMYTRRRQC